LLGKYIKFIALKEAEIELLINFCSNYVQYADRRTSYKPLRLILTRQVEKVRVAIGKLHEDLQYDFINEYNEMLNDADTKLAWFSKTDYLL